MRQKSVPGLMAGRGTPSAFFGFSVTIASVVMRRPAIEAASWSAHRATLAGTMMPWRPNPHTRRSGRQSPKCSCLFRGFCRRPRRHPRRHSSRSGALAIARLLSDLNPSLLILIPGIEAVEGPARMQYQFSFRRRPAIAAIAGALRTSALKHHLRQEKKPHGAEKPCSIT